MPQTCFFQTSLKGTVSSVENSMMLPGADQKVTLMESAKLTNGKKELCLMLVLEHFECA
jgi:hypothetical protein